MTWCSGSAIESPSIPFLPNAPPDEEEEGIEALAQLLVQQLPSSQPPVQHSLLLNDQDFLQLKLSQQNAPNFLAEGTGGPLFPASDHR